MPPILKAAWSGISPFVRIADRLAVFEPPEGQRLIRPLVVEAGIEWVIVESKRRF